MQSLDVLPCSNVHFLLHLVFGLLNSDPMELQTYVNILFGHSTVHIHVCYWNSDAKASRKQYCNCVRYVCFFDTYYLLFIFGSRCPNEFKCSCNSKYRQYIFIMFLSSWESTRRSYVISSPNSKSCYCVRFSCKSIPMQYIKIGLEIWRIILFPNLIFYWYIWDVILSFSGIKPKATKKKKEFLVAVTPHLFPAMWNLYILVFS